MKNRFIFVSVFVLIILLSGCISDDKSFNVNIKSSHTWSLDIRVDVRVWDNYSKINLEPDFLFSEVDKLYIDELDVFSVSFNMDNVGFIEIIINASTIDGFSDELIFSSINLSENYNFDVIGSGNEINIIKRV
jgi:hypothetical protein